MALVRSFAGNRVANDKRCDKRVALVTAVLLWCNWQKKAFTHDHFTPRAARVNPRQVSCLRAESGTQSDRWWCDSSGIEKKLKEVFDLRMHPEVANNPWQIQEIRWRSWKFLRRSLGYPREIVGKSPLFDFSNYCESLPKREGGKGAISLYKMPYFVQQFGPCFSMVSGCNWIRGMVGSVCEALPWSVL